MKVHASLKNLRIAPRKVRLVSHTIVGLSVTAALIQLSKQLKRSSDPMLDLLKSAIANAKNNFGLDENNLYVAQVCVGDGLRIKRFEPRAFGRSMPILKRSTNVKVILEEREEGKNRQDVTKKQEIVTIKDAAAVEEIVVKEGKKKSSIVDDRKKEAKPKTALRSVKKVFQRKAS
ncbi:MAG: 50S ribosomal protein L22 [Candidatus Moranbacteria bacterium]|jgi:large subunit ribosomal protein L22|nr:50S ribosomal protein L22 [Candidatus Moranbacteria bacterium]MBP9801150.1 50S ribosomal protein L22 [Candidatus Moranbacteria bacterium]